VKKLPVFPTLVVAIAVTVMVMLGFWQLQRLHAKDAELAKLAAAAGQAPLPFPRYYLKDDPRNYYYRKSAGYCALVTSWSATAGSNAQGEPGWSHLADCFTGEAQSMNMVVDIGWSRGKENPKWDGGQVSGMIVPDAQHILKIIAYEPAFGLEASAQPKVEDGGNPYQGAYWWVWFTFAALAPAIYILALRRRQGS
jgi:surfeit locus 1 family protein